MESMLGDTLEEGRKALILLEKQLNEHRDNIQSDASLGSNSRQTSQSRRLLDKVSRDARLHNRKGSPLGLTIEELDDRGLLNGGGSNRSGSIRQKNRRPLEMRNRQARLLDRDNEIQSRNASGLFHMLRILTRRGLLIEAVLRERDSEGRGILPKSTVYAVLRSFGIPYTKKEFCEIIDRYSSTSNHDTDYETFLRDAGVPSIQQNSEEVSQSTEAYGSILVEVKRIILELVSRYGKSFDEIYGMFACWDHEGSGLITSTQFLRVLSRLRIELSDGDQDFLVELLDVNSMGRIDFGRLLSFCFGDSASSIHQADDKFLPQENGPHNNHGDLFNGTTNRRPRTASKADKDGSSNSMAIVQSNSRIRPTTASARVSETDRGISRSAQFEKVLYEGEFSKIPYDDDRHLIIEFPDDVIDDELQQLTPSTFVDSLGKSQEIFSAVRGPNDNINSNINIINEQNWPDNHEIGSLNDTTLVTDQEDSNFGSPFRANRGISNIAARPQDLGSASVGYPGSNLHLQPNELIDKLDNNIQAYGFKTTSLQGDGKVLNREPHPIQSNWYNESGQHRIDLAFADSLVTRASQFLLRLRDRLYLQYKNGVSLHDLFHVFASENRKAFVSSDLLRVLAHMEDIDEDVADHILRSIALDGYDFVSFAEFKVFVTDHDFKDLEWAVYHQMAQQLERVGRQYQVILSRIFFDIEGAIINKNVFVSISTFRDGLFQLGLKLSNHDIQRLAIRFDINEDGTCSVGTFIQSVKNSPQWKNAERVLCLQDEAIVEASHIREQQRLGYFKDISEELLAMSEFLGIRPISEQSLLWIAVDALRAPLPINWSAQKDNAGRIYFYNHISNQSRWDHPLDSHFRMLRDEHRYSSANRGSFNLQKVDTRESKLYRPVSAVDKSQIVLGMKQHTSDGIGGFPSFRPQSAPNNKGHTLLQDKMNPSSAIKSYFASAVPNHLKSPTMDEIYINASKRSVKPVSNSGTSAAVNGSKGKIDKIQSINGTTFFKSSKLLGLERDSKDKPHDFSIVPPTKKEISQMAHLANMFDDTIIEKLDCIIVPKQGETQPALPRPKTQSEAKKARGGIVLL